MSRISRMVLPTFFIFTLSYTPSAMGFFSSLQKRLAEAIAAQEAEARAAEEQVASNETELNSFNVYIDIPSASWEARSERVNNGALAENTLPPGGINNGGGTSGNDTNGETNGSENETDLASGDNSASDTDNTSSDTDGTENEPPVEQSYAGPIWLLDLMYGDDLNSGEDELTALKTRQKYEELSSQAHSLGNGLKIIGGRLTIGSNDPKLSI